MMDDTLLYLTLGRHGVLDAAVPDAVRRAQEHFGATEPSQSDLEAWAASLAHEAGHLFAPAPAPVTPPPEAEPYPVWMNSVEKLTRYRQQHPAPVKAKPTSRHLTQTELQELDRAGLSIYERLTRAREMLAEQGRGEGT